MPHLLLTTAPSSGWLSSLDDNLPAVVISCMVVLLLAILALTLLLMKRRDMATVQQADESFLAALQGALHVLGVYQD